MAKLEKLPRRAQVERCFGLAQSGARHLKSLQTTVRRQELAPSDILSAFWQTYQEMESLAETHKAIVSLIPRARYHRIGSTADDNNIADYSMLGIVWRLAHQTAREITSAAIRDVPAASEPCAQFWPTICGRVKVLPYFRFGINLDESELRIEELEVLLALRDAGERKHRAKATTVAGPRGEQRTRAQSNKTIDGPHNSRESAYEASYGSLLAISNLYVLATEAGSPSKDDVQRELNVLWRFWADLESYSGKDEFESGLVAVCARHPHVWGPSTYKAPLVVAGLAGDLVGPFHDAAAHREALEMPSTVDPRIFDCIAKGEMKACAPLLERPIIATDVEAQTFLERVRRVVEDAGVTLHELSTAAEMQTVLLAEYLAADDDDTGPQPTEAAVEAVASNPAAVEAKPESKGAVEDAGKRLWTLEAADPVVKAYLKNHRYATASEIERETGISDSTVCNTQSWRNRSYKRKSGKQKGRHRRTVPLGEMVKTIAAKVGGPDVDIDAMIERCKREPTFRKEMAKEFHECMQHETEREQGHRPEPT